MKKTFRNILLFLLQAAVVTPLFAQTPTPTMVCCTPASNWVQPHPTAAFGVAVDTVRNRVYVTDTGSSPGEGKVMAFNYDGSVASSFGTSGAVSLAGALWVAVGNGSYDGVYVAQRDNGQGVTKLDPNGNVVWSRDPVLFGGWRGVALDNWGNVYATNEFGGLIYIWDNNGNPRSPVFTGSALNAPTGMWMSGLNLFVADTLNNRIVKYAESGVNTFSFNETQAVTLAMDPYGITMDGAGNIYIASKSQGYAVFDGNLLQKTVICAFGTSIGIALDQFSNIYVATDNAEVVVKNQACFPSSGFTPTPTPPSPLSGAAYIYPSPARGSQAKACYPMAESGRVNLKVWNEKAELMDELTEVKSSGVQVSPFNISGYTSGVYFYSLTLTYDSGKVETIKPRKFVVIH